MIKKSHRYSTIMLQVI